MKVLVTGATGFVGRHLVAALLCRGYEVRAVARNVDVAATMPWIDKVEFIATDIHSDTLNITKLVNGVEVLAHLAWPGLPNYQALFHIEYNLMADYRFIKSAVEADIKQVLVTGTCFEYGLLNGPLDESFIAQPKNAYGIAKNTLRVFLQILQREHPFVLQWARLFYLHGAGQNSASLLAALDRAIDHGEAQFNMSGGEQIRDYMAVDAAANHLVSIIGQRKFDGVVNCCSGEPISVRSLVERRVQARESSIQLNFGHYPYPTHEPMAFWGEINCLRALVEDSYEA